MIRRRPKAQRKFESRDVFDLYLSGTEHTALKQIQRGGVSKARLRERLASKGLVTSKVGSKCVLTRRGKMAVNFPPR